VKRFRLPFQPGGQNAALRYLAFAPRPEPREHQYRELRRRQHDASASLFNLPTAADPTPEA